MATSLLLATPTDAVRPVVSRIRRLISCAMSRRRPEQLEARREVEKRLVQRQAFDLRRELMKHREHLVRDFLVTAHARRDADGVRAAAQSFAHRHRRVHAETAHFIACRCDHAASCRCRRRSPACPRAQADRAARPTRRTRPCRRAGWRAACPRGRFTAGRAGRDLQRLSLLHCDRDLLRDHRRIVRRCAAIAEHEL